MRNRTLAEVTRADDFIVSDQLVSLYLTQVAENKALSVVFDDIFDAEGSEIYLRPIDGYVALERPLTFYTLVEAARRRGEIAIGYRIQAPPAMPPKLRRGGQPGQVGDGDVPGPGSAHRHRRGLISAATAGRGRQLTSAATAGDLDRARHGVNLPTLRVAHHWEQYCRRPAVATAGEDR